MPEELQDAGPLVLDVVESYPGFIAKAPNRPTFSAIVVNQEGHFDTADGAQLSWQLSKSNEKERIEKPLQPALWRHLYALRNVDDPLLSPLRAAVRRIARTRHMLESLGRSNVRVGDQPALTIYHGLAISTSIPTVSAWSTSAPPRGFYALELLNELIDGNLTGDAKTRWHLSSSMATTPHRTYR